MIFYISIHCVDMLFIRHDSLWIFMCWYWWCIYVFCVCLIRPRSVHGCLLQSTTTWYVVLHTWVCWLSPAAVLFFSRPPPELLDIVKARKLAYYSHTMRKQGSFLVKEIMQGTMPGARRRGRPHTAWIYNIKTWTGLPVEESVRMTADRDK